MDGDESRRQFGRVEPLHRSGFSGAISLPLLPDLIQIYTVSLANGALTIRRGVDQGTIWFEQGQMVHAECGDLVGEEAVYQLLHWENGHFSLDPNGVATERTISSSWQNVLMEGCRRLDEDGVAAPLPAPAASDFPTDVANAVSELAESLEGFRAAAVFDKDGNLVAQRTAVTGLELASIGGLLQEMLRLQIEASRAASPAQASLMDCLWILEAEEQLVVPLADGGILYVLLARDSVNLAVVRRLIGRITTDIS